METFDNKKCAVEPIRGSVSILAVKYILLLSLFDGLYALLYYILSLQFSLPFDLHHHLAIVFMTLFVVKLVFQIYTIIFVTLSWANSVYYLTDTELIKQKGILGRSEEKYSFDSVISISIDRSFLGNIFGFGDLRIVVTSKQGGKELVLSGIADPFKYEKMLKGCCKNLKVNSNEIVFNR